MSRFSVLDRVQVRVGIAGVVSPRHEVMGGLTGTIIEVGCPGPAALAVEFDCYLVREYIPGLGGCSQYVEYFDERELNKIGTMPEAEAKSRLWSRGNDSQAAPKPTVTVDRALLLTRAVADYRTRVASARRALEYAAFIERASMLRWLGDTEATLWGLEKLLAELKQ